jgi:hypothetical protein
MFDKRKAFVVVLDTMWGEGGDAPKWFLINPSNHSGRRLYSLTGSHYGNIAVVNACPGQTTHATKHGTPSPIWLAHSLLALPKHYTRRGVPLLVCGKVAQSTFEQLTIQWGGPVLYIDHPAARSWTKAKLDQVRKQIRRAMPLRWR